MEEKEDPKPWSLDLNVNDLQKIFEFAHQEFLSRNSLYNKPDHFYIRCVLEGYSRLLKKKEHEKT